MDNVEPFLLSQTTPGLQPGERILGQALLRRPREISVIGVPQDYENFLGVATDRRLVLFETEVGGFLSPVAKPVARNPVVWNYDELVKLGDGGIGGAVVHSGGRGRCIYMVPGAGLGPFAAKNPDDEREVAGSARRYDVYAEIEGLPGQTDFLDKVVPWLVAQFQAGAFAPTAERRAELEARVAQARAHATAAREQDAAASKARRPKLVMGAIGVVATIVALGALVLASIYSDSVAYYEEDIEAHEQVIAFREADLAWSRSGGPLPPGCPETEVLGSIAGLERWRCHGCATPNQGGYGGPTSQRVVRDGQELICPSPEEREQEIVRDRERMEQSREMRTENLALTIGLAFVALLSVVGGALGIWRVRRKAG